MPADRMLHPRQGHSAKVSSLSDFEYRVWSQALLSADDFGVLPFSAIRLQADNDSLAGRPSTLVQKALERLRAVELLLVFEHQGKAFACHPAWQIHQKIRYPRETIHPKPPAEVLARCDQETAKLFEVHPKPPQKPRGNVPETFPEFSGNRSEPFPSLARAGARETANANAKAHANANAQRREKWYEECARLKHEPACPHRSAHETVMARTRQAVAAS